MSSALRFYERQARVVFAWLGWFVMDMGVMGSISVSAKPVLNVAGLCLADGLRTRYRYRHRLHATRKGTVTATG